MEVLFFALALAVAGAVNVACFAVGVKASQQVAQGQPVKPEHPKRKETPPVPKAQAEDDRARRQLETVLENIESYNGSPYGQKDIPM